MELEIGKIYYRKVNFRATVRQITKLEDKFIYYKTLHGPILKKQSEGKCKKSKFKSWITGEAKDSNYSKLDGCKIDRTFIVQNTQGQPIFRCSERRANFYIKNGYATKLNDDSLKLNNTSVEDKLVELYGKKFTDNPFFMETKNDKCVVCGKNHSLSRHHVIPQRHLGHIPHEIKKYISNILFICWDCHQKYEQFSGLEPISSKMNFVDYISAWEHHFIATMEPLFLPKGWKIWTINPISLQPSML